MSLKMICNLFPVGLFFAFILNSCSSTPDAKNDLNQEDSLFNSAKIFGHEEYFNDTVYNPLLQKWSREVSLYKDFEMSLSGSAILMSPEMVEAYEKKMQKMDGNLLRLDKNLVSKKEDVVSILMIMFSSFKKMNDFDDSDSWNKTLYFQNKWISASNVVEYKNKSGFIPYFPVESHWSKVYVVQFQVPQLKESLSKIGTADAPLVFSLHSGIVNADFYWK